MSLSPKSPDRSTLKLAVWVSCIGAVISVLFGHTPWLFVPVFTWVMCYLKLDSIKTSNADWPWAMKNALYYSLGALLPSSIIQFIVGMLTLELFPRDDARLYKLFFVGAVWGAIGLVVQFGIRLAEKPVNNQRDQEPDR